MQGNGFLNTTVIPKTRKSPKRTFASGKNAIAICDRCGWKYPWKSLLLEPGTNLRVCRKDYDGRYSYVCHPQNYVATDTVDAIALVWSRPDLAINPNAVADTPPFYIATEDGYLVEYGQEMVIETGTSAGLLTYMTPPFGYDT